MIIIPVRVSVGIVQSFRKLGLSGGGTMIGTERFTTPWERISLGSLSCEK
jgi:hypothetical protein